MNQPLKYHGGKSYLADWIQSLAPPHTHRNIVFGGGLGEFWNWPHEGISEAINDADAELINFYTVLKDGEKSKELIRRLSVTPFSDSEFQLANGAFDNPIDRAIAFFVKYRQSRQGLGKSYATPTKRTRRGMNENVSAWLSAVDGLPECRDRLIRVEIRNLDFRDFIRQYDHTDALFYLDPTYLHETRSDKTSYKFEMTDTQHFDLLNILKRLKGKFMLSGYHSVMYDSCATENRWNLHEKTIDNKASSSKIKEKKTECIWTNYVL